MLIPDGRLMVKVRYPKQETEILLLEPKTGQKQVIKPRSHRDLQCIGAYLGQLIFLSHEEAPNGELVAIDPSHPNHRFPFLPEGALPLIEARIVGNEVALVYLKETTSQLYLRNLKTGKVRQVQLPGKGTVSCSWRRLSLSGDRSGLYFAYTDYLQPITIYRYDLANEQLTSVLDPKSPIQKERYEVTHTSYKSKDGTGDSYHNTTPGRR